MDCERRGGGGAGRAEPVKELEYAKLSACTDWPAKLVVCVHGELLTRIRSGGADASEEQTLTQDRPSLDENIRYI